MLTFSACGVRMGSGVCVLGVVIYFSVAQPVAQEAGSSWAIIGATLIDGSGAPPIPASVIRGRGALITCVGTAKTCPLIGVKAIVDATGKWAIPGLIDTHVHLNWSDPEKTRRAQLIRFAFGTTTTREAGTAGHLEANLTHRRQASSVISAEPRLVVSALVSSAEMRRHNSHTVADLVRKLAVVGADAIKVKEGFTADEWRTIAAAAHAAGLPVWGHTWTRFRSQLEEALAGGIDGVSHLPTFSEFAYRGPAKEMAAPGSVEYWVGFKEKWNDVDDARLRTVSDLLIRNGVWFEPTLLTEKHFTVAYTVPDDVGYLADVPSPPKLVRPWIPFGDGSWRASRERVKRIGVAQKQMCDFVGRFWSQGGIVVAGADEEPPGIGLIDEIVALRECGLSPMAALQSATKIAAAALRRPDRGTVEAGKLADLVILDADPLEQPGNLRRVWRVVKGGQVHDPAFFLTSLAGEHQSSLWRLWILPGLGVACLAVVMLRPRRTRNRRTEGRALGHL